MKSFRREGRPHASMAALLLCLYTAVSGSLSWRDGWLSVSLVIVGGNPLWTCALMFPWTTAHWRPFLEQVGMLGFDEVRESLIAKPTSLRRTKSMSMNRLDRLYDDRL